MVGEVVHETKRSKDTVTARGSCWVPHLGLQSSSRCFDKKTLDLPNSLFDPPLFVGFDKEMQFGWALWRRFLPRFIDNFVMEYTTTFEHVEESIQDGMRRVRTQFSSEILRI